MEKQLKNKVFTLVVTIVLVAFGVVMLLGALDVKGFSFARDILRIFTGVFLAIYAALCLFPLSYRYTGKSRYFIFGEIFLVLLCAVGQAACQFLNVPLLSTLSLCACIGFIIWLRGVTETVRVYQQKGTKSAERGAFLRLCGCILLSAFGVWEVARPSIKDRSFLYFLAFASFAFALLFLYFTIRNAKRRW